MMSQTKKEGKVYIAIDLKSFYASVECVDLGLSPLNTNLVVADASRTDKTICLAVTPALKSFGISGRARLFEAKTAVEKVNAQRLKNAPGHKFSGKSHYLSELNIDPSLELDFIVAKPRMARYMEVSNKVYSIYLRHVAPDDIHIYSVDEVMMDVSAYLRGKSPREFTSMLINEVLNETGITATAGIGTNLYLCKVAMDIVAKHIPADENGVRIAELDERTYRELLWEHKPITDFWRIGPGTARRLERIGINTMAGIAECSLGSDNSYKNARLLYDLFGKNAELIIDHAWGCEPCTIKDIKAYAPRESSISSGQVLMRPYTQGEARTIVHEMADSLSMDLVEKGLVCDQIALTVIYDVDNLKDESIMQSYGGKITTDWYGRKMPGKGHGSKNLTAYTASTKKIVGASLELYDEIADRNLLVRRIYIVANHVITEQEAELKTACSFEQMDMFTDYDAKTRNDALEEQSEKSEKNLQRALVSIRKKYGKNSVLKGVNYKEESTGRDRNSQVGGHKA